MATKKDNAAPRAPAELIYCDELYAQRSLFMPSGRELVVLRGQLIVPAGDDEAHQFLDARSDFAVLGREG